MVVEDDQFIRELYERQLKLSGFSVEATFSGKVALELIEKNSYNLLMLDLNIPDVSGFQILDHLKEKPKEGLVILVLSNLGEESYINKALEKGASAYIVKSTYTPERVVKEVKSLLS